MLTIRYYIFFIFIFFSNVIQTALPEQKPIQEIWTLITDDGFLNLNNNDLLELVKQSDYFRNVLFMGQALTTPLTLDDISTAGHKRNFQVDLTQFTTNADLQLIIDLLHSQYNPLTAAKKEEDLINQYIAQQETLGTIAPQALLKLCDMTQRLQIEALDDVISSLLTILLPYYLTQYDFLKAYVDSDNVEQDLGLYVLKDESLNALHHALAALVAKWALSCLPQSFWVLGSISANARLVAFNPTNSNHLFSIAPRSNIVRIWDIANNTSIGNLTARHEYETGFNPIVSFVCHPNGITLALTTASENLFLCDINSKNCYSYGYAHKVPLAFNPNGRELAYVRPSDIQILQGTNWLPPFSTPNRFGVNTIKLGYRPHTISFNNRGTLIAFDSQYSRSINIWDLQKNRIITTLEKTTSNEQVMKVLFSPKQDDILVSQYSDNSLCIWNTTTNKILHSISEPNLNPQTLAFNPEGTQIAGGTYSTICIWNVLTGQKLLSLPKQSATSIAFSPDSKILACATNNGIRLWKTTNYVENSLEKYSVHQLLLIAAEFNNLNKYFTNHHTNQLYQTKRDLGITTWKDHAKAWGRNVKAGLMQRAGFSKK